MWIALIVGTGIVLYGLLASYQFGAFRHIGLPMLWIDGLAGVGLAFTPWMLGVSDTVWVPHVVVGMSEVAIAMLACLIPSYTGTAVT